MARGRLVGFSLLLLLGCSDDSGGDDGNAASSSDTGNPADSGTTTWPLTSDSGTTQNPGSSGAPDTTSDGTTATSSDSTGADESTGTAAGCGNGMVEDDEACDDGNRTNADGCNNDCTVSGSILWSHTQAGGNGANEHAGGVAVDPEGRAYVAGNLDTGTSTDYWVRQYEADGGLGWTQTYDASGSNDAANAIAYADDRVYTAGSRLVSTFPDVWFRVLDTEGSSQTSGAYNGIFNNTDVGLGVAVDPAGNFVVVGHETVFEQGLNVWVREYDPVGATRWTQTLTGSANASAAAVAIDAAGNIAVTGFNTVTGAGRDLWLRYYNTEGTAQWTRTYQADAGGNDQGQGVAFDSAGNVVVTGFETGADLPSLMVLAKYEPVAGEQQWLVTWSGEMAEGARGYAVAVDSADDIIVVGDTERAGLSDIFVRKHDTDGNPRWITPVAGAEGTDQVGRAVAVGPDDHLWIAGGLDLGADARDIYVARVAP